MIVSCSSVTQCFVVFHIAFICLFSEIKTLIGAYKIYILVDKYREIIRRLYESKDTRAYKVF